MRRCIFILWALFLIAIPVAFAQNDYPPQTDTYINDFANLLTPETEGYLRQFLTDLQAAQGIEMTVVTIGSVSDYGTGDSTIESFARRLFNAWGIDDAATNDGVLLLTAVNDRKVRIEVGSSYGDSMDTPMQNVINENILPAFRDEDYETGIYRGTRAIIATLTGTAPADPRPAPPFDLAKTLRSINPSQAIFGLFVLGAGGFFLRRRIRTIQANTRYCPKCKAKMKRESLPENASQLLNDVQRLEQKLAFANYTVYVCSNGHKPLVEAPLAITQRTPCESCDARTLERTNTKVTADPTETSVGAREVTERCRNCGHTKTRTETIPRLLTEYERRQQAAAAAAAASSSWDSDSSSSSSDSGSSSGGSSDGGGASGSW
ncbi:MAG: TPM domain-containing protein [Anaerolineae bacterium]|nr:TPM domain-containing protein [Anaerolineae bacterium]